MKITASPGFHECKAFSTLICNYVFNDLNAEEMSAGDSLKDIEPHQLRRS